MSLQYNYNKSGAERKTLVQAISGILGIPAAYQGTPTFAFAIGGYTVDRNGVLSCPEDACLEEIMRLLSRLQALGYTPENAGSLPAGNISVGNSLVIEISKDGFTETALGNLHKIIASKEKLLRNALGADSLPVIDTGKTLRFPWFTLHGLDGEADAYSRLVTGICKMAKRQKRVTAKETGMENGKFDMRLFLVRLGFIGDEYKTARKILLRSLTGNSSWKSGHAPERPAQPDNVLENTGTINTSIQLDERMPEKEGGEHYDKHQ